MAKIKKLTVKILLDIVMCLALVLLYKAKVLTLTYHEVVGIGILLVFLAHVLLNRTWVVNVGKKLFSPETPARTKFSYWMTVLLVVCFLIIVFSGLMISKVLFKDWFAAVGFEPEKSFWRPMHLFASAISLVLVGIHLGLYWDMVKAFFRKYLNIPATTTKAVCYTVLAAMLVWGCVSIPQAGMVKWLLSPVTPASERSHGDDATTDQADEVAGEAGERTGESESPGDGVYADQADERTSEDTSVDDERAEGASERSTTDDRSTGSADGATDAAVERTHGSTSDSASPEPVEVAGIESADIGAAGAQTATESSSSGNHGTNVTLANTLLVISQITSIIAVFATLTYWVDRALKEKRRAAKAGRP